ncbi:interferon-induced protein 44-like [Salvelinus sp. IW2-2015]|uniref:interferon-induced protein 44-like n=1 Tax=Salvelinus sp. IW2-2015 TaxID=2691554 RepID=UPI0038D35E5B
MPKDVIDKMKELRQKASRLKIPQVVVMTMPDKACELVNKDVNRIYYSKEIKKKMQICSNELGVPMNCVLPVKNYHEEGMLDNDMDILILNAMTQIMNFANDYLWDLQQHANQK